MQCGTGGISSRSDTGGINNIEFRYSQMSQKDRDYRQYKRYKRRYKQLAGMVQPFQQSQGGSAYDIYINNGAVAATRPDLVDRLRTCGTSGGWCIDPRWVRILQKIADYTSLQEVAAWKQQTGGSRRLNSFSQSVQLPPSLIIDGGNPSIPSLLNLAKYENVWIGGFLEDEKEAIYKALPKKKTAVDYMKFAKRLYSSLRRRAGPFTFLQQQKQQQQLQLQPRYT